jgi:pyrimidine operon attenuation protein/uracil phosphoribosyltransferase
MGFEVEYMTLLVYLSQNKKGSSEYRNRCASVIQEIKRANPDIIALVCQRIRENEQLRAFVSNSTLVGIPSSSIKEPDSLHGPRSLAREMEQFKGTHVDLLSRKIALPKSAFIPQAVERPSPTAHAESLQVEANLHVGAHVLLVDDLLTSGRTASSGKLLQVRAGSMLFNSDGTIEFKNEQAVNI